jgi:RNA-directed DNA polymerase
MKHPWSSQSFREGALAAGRSTEMIDAAEIAASAIKRNHPDLPVVFTLHHLAHLADVSVDLLQDVAFRKEDYYRVFRVKKRGNPKGGAAPPRRYRTICVPHPGLMQVQRWIAQNILNTIEPHGVSFAFAPRRDLTGAAERHHGARWLVKLDVRHFFESILEDQVYRVFRTLGYGALLSFQFARICTRLPSYKKTNTAPLRGRSSVGLPYRRYHPGHLPQGAPTSPMLANLVVYSLDERLSKIAIDRGWTYTRYADDLAFSRRDDSSRRESMSLAKQVERELVAFGLISNRQKTAITPPGGRKILLGVLVDRERPRLTRAFRNNIETHLYALTSPKIGPAAHRAKRGFASTIGMRRHIAGLIAFAHLVDKHYAARLFDQFNTVNWEA